jgi:hypothetical protein
LRGWTCGAGEMDIVVIELALLIVAGAANDRS